MLSSWDSRRRRPCSMGNIKQNINTAIIDCAMVPSITITQASFSSKQHTPTLPPPLLPHTHPPKSITKPQSHLYSASSSHFPRPHSNRSQEHKLTPLETKSNADLFILLPLPNTPCVSMISKFSPVETTNGVDSVPIVPKNTEREKPAA